MARKKARRRGASTGAAPSTQATMERRFRQAEWDLADYVDVRKLLRRSGIIGVDIGFRERGGKPTNEVAIRILVKRKPRSNDAKLRANQLLPPKFGRTPVDVIEDAGYEPTQPNHITGGMAVAPAFNVGVYGTMGISVRTPGKGLDRLLTNAHVVLGGRKRKEFKVAPAGSWQMVQPLGRTVGPAIKGKLFLNTDIDAALIDPSSIAVKPGVLGIDPPPTRVRRLTRLDVARKTRVLMVGAKSRVDGFPLATGVVDSVSRTFRTCTSITCRKLYYAVGMIV